MQRKFQQSKPIVLEVPQILFIVRVLDIPVMPLRQVRTVQTVQLFGCPVDMPVVVLDKCMIQTVQKTEGLGWLPCPSLCNDRCPVWSRQC